MWSKQYFVLLDVGVVHHMSWKSSEMQPAKSRHLHLTCEDLPSAMMQPALSNFLQSLLRPRVKDAGCHKSCVINREPLENRLLELAVTLTRHPKIPMAFKNPNLCLHVSMQQQSHQAVTKWLIKAQPKIGIFFLDFLSWSLCVSLTH